jgi:hypothetical protein
MKTITADRPVICSRVEPNSRSVLRILAFAIAAPVLAVALSCGFADACAYTQHNLMGIYTTSLTAS